MDQTKKRSEIKLAKLGKKRKWLTSLIGIHEADGKNIEWVSIKAYPYLYCSRLLYSSFLKTFALCVTKKIITSIGGMNHNIQQFLIVILNGSILFFLISPLLFLLIKFIKVLPAYYEINFLISETDKQIRALEKAIQTRKKGMR